MAHFARLENNIVREVIVINNDMLLDDQGNEKEELGIEFCKFLYGSDTEWKQTSYNGTFRGRFAGSGEIYDPELDVFGKESITE